MDYSTPVLPVHLQLPELAQIHVHRIHAIQPFHPLPSNHVIFCCPLLLLPSIFPIIRGLSNESVLCIRWPKYWPQLQHQFSNEYSGLISFRIDWFDLLTVQGTLKSLLQHHSSKASILWHSTFLIAQLSHPYVTTGKTIALTRWTFVDKVMSLLFNMLSRWVRAFLPRSKHLLISWLQSPSAVILEPKKIKSVTVSIVYPPICHEVMGLDVDYFCFIDYTKAFDCVDHNKLWEILEEMGIPDHLTYLMRNLCPGLEATVRTRHGTMDWFKIGKGI